MFTTLLWATDGSAEAEAALSHALELLAPEGHLLAFHCDQRFFGGRAGGEPLIADEPDRIERIRERVEQLRADGIDVELVLDTSHESAADEAARIAEESHADAIVCGSRGLGAVSSALLGSFTRRLLHVAACPVLVVPERVAKKHAEHATTA